MRCCVQLRGSITVCHTRAVSGWQLHRARLRPVRGNAAAGEHTPADPPGLPASSCPWTPAPRRKAGGCTVDISVPERDRRPPRQVGYRRCMVPTWYEMLTMRALAGRRTT